MIERVQQLERRYFDASRVATGSSAGRAPSCTPRDGEGRRRLEASILQLEDAVEAQEKTDP